MSAEIENITYTCYEYTDSITEKHAFEKLKQDKLVTLNELEGFGDKVSIVLWQNGKPTDVIFPYRMPGWLKETTEKLANQEFTIEILIKIKLGEKIYERSYHLKCPNRSRQVLNVEDGGRVTVLVEPIDYKSSLFDCVDYYKNNFYLSESELLTESENLLAQQYKYCKFKNQVEISGCIADGLAFLGEAENHKCKIIGFEAKSNRDTYKRLYSQLNSYLSVCDEVYLIVEDKKIPRDLPFFVGVISAKAGDSKVIRKATSLKHSIDAGDYWKTLLKNAAHHAGLNKKDSLETFFNAVENIKRKLIWNQFVIGFHQSYVYEYIPLTEQEKRLMKEYFYQEQVVQETKPEFEMNLMKWINE